MRALALTAVALALTTTACQRNKTLAAFDLLDQSGLLSTDQREQLNEHLTGALGQGGKQRVLPRARTKGLCPALEPDCLATEAKKLEAGGYTTARVLKHGPECSLVLKFFRSKGRAARFSTAVQSSCDPAGLATAIDLAALRLLSPDPSADQREAEAAMRARMQKEEMERRKQEMRRAEEEAKRAAEEALKKAQAAKLQAEMAARDKLEDPLASEAVSQALVESQPEPVPQGSATTGRVMITSNPWAKVFCQGRQLGVTPLQVDLPAGHHLLVLEGADGMRVEREVVVEAGKDISLKVRLAQETGRLNRAQILKVFKRGKGQLMDCLRLHPKLSGPGPLRITLELTIQPSGKVSEVIAKPEEVFSAVRTCVQKKARRWKFPAYEGPATKLSLPVLMSR